MSCLRYIFLLTASFSRCGFPVLFFEADFVVKTLLAHTKRCSTESNK